MTGPSLERCELLPCPFCGSVQLRPDGPRSIWIHCCGCGADGPEIVRSYMNTTSREEAIRKAIAAWNRRAELARRVEGREAVAWQYRVMDGSGKWDDWRYAKDESHAKDYLRIYKQAEVRALYASPSDPCGLSAAEDGALYWLEQWKEGELPPYGKIKLVCAALRRLAAATPPAAKGETP